MMPWWATATKLQLYHVVTDKLVHHPKLWCFLPHLSRHVMVCDNNEVDYELHINVPATTDHKSGMWIIMKTCIDDALEMNRGLIRLATDHVEVSWCLCPIGQSVYTSATPFISTTRVHKWIHWDDRTVCSTCGCDIIPVSDPFQFL